MVGVVARDITISAEGLQFDSRTGQIRQSVAKGSPPWFHRSCVAQALLPANRYTLRRNTASIMKA